MCEKNNNTVSRIQMKYRFPAIIPAAINHLYCKACVRWFRLLSRFLCLIWGVKAGKNVFFYGKTLLRSRGYGIRIGNNVRFNSFRRLNLVGLINPNIIDNSHGGKIEVGNDCGFSSVVISSRSSIKIGSRVLVGGNVRIFDHDFHSIDHKYRGTKEDFANTKTKPIIIGDDCFIGTNTIILKGTSLGARTIVSAGSVVHGLITPEGALVKGNPAQIIVKL